MSAMKALSEPVRAGARSPDEILHMAVPALPSHVLSCMRSRAALACVATLCCCAMASEQTCRKVPFTLLGSGGVGAALLKAIVGARELHDTSYGLRFCAKAVCDSSGIAKATDGELSDEAIADLGLSLHDVQLILCETERALNL